MKKIYLGNTLIHDEKEYNEMKENIQNLQTQLDESANHNTWNAQAFNATIVDFRSEGSLGIDDLSKVKQGDKFELYVEYGTTGTYEYYTVLSNLGGHFNINDNTGKGGLLLIHKNGSLHKLEVNKILRPIDSITWGVRGDELYKITSFTGTITKPSIDNFSNVKCGDIIDIIPNTGSSVTPINTFVVISSTIGYPDFDEETNIPAILAARKGNTPKLYNICTNGNIIPVDAETLNGYKASVTPVSNTIPVRDEGNVITVSGINTSGFSYTFTSTGWYRILNITENSKNKGNAIGLKITSNYNITKNCSYTFEINSSWDNISINQFASISTDNIIPKIRIGVKDHNAGFVDIYYESTGVNTVNFSFDGQCKYVLIPNPDIANGYTATEFTTVNGFKSQINNTEVSYSKTINGSIKVSEGGNTAMTTNQFLTRLAELGGFENSKHITFICSHSYANNDYIASPVGNISLSGAIINIYCNNYNTNIASGWAMYDIIIMTASVSNNINSYDNNIFVLRKTGTNPYTWKRLVNSDELPLKGSVNGFTNWTAVPVERKVYTGAVTSDVTVGLAKAIPSGENITLLFVNNTSSNKTISLTNFSDRNVDTITIAPNKKAEVNLLSIGDNNPNNCYARGINYED